MTTQSHSPDLIVFSDQVTQKNLASHNSRPVNQASKITLQGLPPEIEKLVTHYLSRY